MPVTVRGKQFYTKAEVSSMAPTATIDSTWETKKLTLTNGYVVGWAQNAFHINKRTGLVTGTIGLGNIGTATSLEYATNADLGTHADLAIRYPGQFIYATNASADNMVKANYRNLNTNISTTGVFTLQGNVTSITAERSNFRNFIENFAYIGSKYGKITTQDVKVEYMQEGAFYSADSIDLLLGRAWLKKTLPLPTGYNTSNSYIVMFKNLWSGEIIMQYSLYPTTSGKYPSIALPERFRMLKNGTSYLSAYLPTRYVSSYNTAPTASSANHHVWMNIGSAISFGEVPSTASWITGSQFYQGNPENRPQQNTSETVVGLWMPDHPAQAVPSVNNNIWPTGYTEGFVNTSNSYNTGYTNRVEMPSWVSYNKRTGMVFSYFDFTTTGNALPDPVMISDWNAPYIPSYRYNQVSGTSQTVYLGTNAYMSASTNTSALTGAEYVANLRICTGPSLGNVSNVTNGRKWSYGTSGTASPIINNLQCYHAQYLGNTDINIKA